MNTPSNVMPESSFSSQGTTPVAFSAARPFFWCLRRELWENPLIYVVPLAAAAVFIIGFLINMISLRYHLHGASNHVLTVPYELSAALIMGTALLVGIFYSLDALYGERRDRSILFWKSLPVSDLTTVLSKLSIPLVIIPVLSYAITVVTQFIMLLLSSVVLLGSGADIAALWTHGFFGHVSLGLFNHMFTVHGLWYAPLYGWMLLVSAWAPRAPLIWAVLPPFVISGVEKIAFNTSHFLAMLQVRLSGPQNPAATTPSGMDAMTDVPHGFFSEPGLWIGLIIAALFIAAAVRLRRYRGPID